MDGVHGNIFAELCRFGDRERYNSPSFFHGEWWCTMETLEMWVSDYWLWFGLAALLLALEAFFGSFMFLAASVAALTIGGLSHMYPYVGLEIQLLFFVVLASTMIWLTRSWLAARQEKLDRLQGVVASQSYIGREFRLVSPITDGVSSLNIDGVVWQLRGADAPAGALVRIVAMGEGTLDVEPVTP